MRRAHEARLYALTTATACGLALLAGVVGAPARAVMQNLVFDQYQRWKPRPYAFDQPVRIVAVDDESLKRLGQRPASRPGGALRLWTEQRRGDRLGFRPACGASRPPRRRVLRVSAPLRRRPRARGQPDRGRLRRRTLLAAARTGRTRGDLPSALARPGLIHLTREAYPRS